MSHPCLAFPGAPEGISSFAASATVSAVNMRSSLNCVGKRGMCAFSVHVAVVDRKRTCRVFSCTQLPLAVFKLVGRMRLLALEVWLGSAQRQTMILYKALSQTFGWRSIGEAPVFVQAPAGDFFKLWSRAKFASNSSFSENDPLPLFIPGPRFYLTLSIPLIWQLHHAF